MTTARDVIALRRGGFLLSLPPVMSSSELRGPCGQEVTVMVERQSRPAGGHENLVIPAPSWIHGLFASPILWGAGLTVGFYQLIPFLPVQRDLVQRYFCSHPLEYAIAGLFFTGVAILLMKLLSLSRESAALRGELLPAGLLRNVNSAEDLASVTADEVQRMPARLRRTHIARRLADVVGYLRGRRSTEGLEEHLKYLADQSSDRLHDSYGLVRTINWAVPIIGFLGTVIGITLAIANLKPEQLATSLNEVTGGLAVAFDTTASSLALTLILVFGYFLVERAEQKILADVEDFGVRRIACACPAESRSDNNELYSSPREANERWLQRTEEMLQLQTQLWQESVEGLRNRWQQTIEQQQSQLAAALTQGVSASLDSHTTQLEDVRREFLTAYSSVADRLDHSLTTFQTANQADRAEHTERLVSSFATVQTAIADLRVDLGMQVRELREQKDMLGQVVAEEQQLARLQQSLAQNMEVLRNTGSFEETLHSLSAAVHLLTARTRTASPRADAA